MSTAVRPESVAAAPAVMTHRQIMEALSGLMLALFVALLSSTIVSNALPTIIGDLNGSQTQYTWIITATLLTSTATTPIWGKLADLFSKKLLLQIAIVIFVLGSALSGLSGSAGELIFFRALQGIGLGGVQALAQTVMATIIPPRERGRYNGYQGAVMALAMIGGPLVGGVIVGSPLGWRGVFYVGVPFALAALFLLQKTLHLPVIKRDVKIDYAGAGLITGGVSLLLIWVSFAGSTFNWLSAPSAIMAGAGVLMLLAALWVESRAAEPIVPLALVVQRTPALAIAGSLAVGIAIFGASLFLGQYFQIARGFSPTEAGLQTIPMMVGLIGASTLSGRLITRHGKWKRYLVAGAVLLVVGFSMLSVIDHTTSLIYIGVAMFLVGCGVGMTMQNLVLSVQNTVDISDIGAGTSTVTFFRSLGGTIGVSVLGAVLATGVAGKVTSGLAALGISGTGDTSDLDLAALPAPVAQVVRAAYGDVTGHIFLISAIVALLGLIAILFIREVPLRTSFAAEEAADTAIVVDA